MKKIILALVGIIILAVIAVGIMFKFSICPPKGPWPTPPWCVAEFTRYEYEVAIKPAYLPQIKAVNMYDTWGRNYNMGMIETTQANIESSFDRVKSLGAQEVFIHDFDRAVYSGETDFTSTNYQLVDEIFLNDMRDEAISAEDIKKLADSAHSRGLKLGIKRNIAFVNIGKYIADGITGNISGSVAADYQKFNEAHSEEWIRDYFTKWQGRMLEKGKMYQEAGVDIMSISPFFQEPTFAGHEKVANELWNNLIIELKKNFKGEVIVDYNIYGLIDGKNGREDWTQYDYYKNADIVEVKVYSIPGKYQEKDGNFDERMRAGIERMVADIDSAADKSGIKISLFFAPSSYKNGIFAGPVEYLDINNSAIKALAPDYDEQVKAFDYLFAAVKDRTSIERINAGNFAWDDAIDPEVKPKISISAGFRNKPAEDVVESWFTFSR